MKRITLTLLSTMLWSIATIAQTYSPVTVTGFSIDGIAEDTMAITHTTRSLDGSDYILYTHTYGTRYSTGYGLPDNGIITSGTHTYQLAPYSGNNILFLLQGATDSLILATPAPFAKLSILATSTEGAGTNSYTIRFTDGTSTSFTNVVLNDWFNGSGSITTSIDRAGRSTGNPDHNSTHPSLYANDLSLTCTDQAKLVRSIVVANVGTHPRTCVFAVAGVAASSYSITHTNPTCHGGQGRAVITASGGNTPYNFTWSTSPIQNSDTAVGLVAGPYTVTATDGSSCSVMLHDTLTQPAGSNLSLVASADSTCPGAAITLTTSGATTYTWSVGTATDSSIVVHPFVSTVYSVTGTNGAGCSGAGTLAVHVRIPPTIGINITPGRFVCAGTTVTLSGTGAVSYHWSNAVTNGTGFVPTAATTTYTVTGTDARGCTNMDSLNVYVYQAPALTIIASPSDSICGGANLSLSGTGASTYQWSGNVTNGLQFAAPVSTTSYRVTGTDAHNCVNIDSITIYIKPAPTVSAGPASDTVCLGHSLTLSGAGAASYQWSGGVTNGTSFTPSTSGTYTVTGTGANGCTRTAAVAVVVRNCAGIDESNSQLTLNLYPNPNNGTFTLISGGDAKDMVITLTDMQGRVLVAFATKDVHAGDSRIISVGNAAKGIYLLTVKTDSQQSVHRLSIQ